MSQVECVLDARAELGESPVWSATEQALYWLDIIGQRLHRFEPATGATREWPLPARPGSLALCAYGDVLLAMGEGFHRLDLDSGRLQLLQRQALPEGCRFNDGKVSPDGRFFVGSMDEAQLSRRLGVLYRFDPDGRCEAVLDDLIVSNGLAWSPDGRQLWHSDSKGQLIRCFDYHNGQLSNPREIARPDEAAGRPDGAAMDVDGFYWSAGISAGVLNRWAPDGRLDRRVELPCAAPTMPCFGGPDMKTLFITSLRHGLSAAQLAHRPLSGGLFALRVDVAGVPVARFKQ